MGDGDLIHTRAGVFPKIKKNEPHQKRVLGHKNAPKKRRSPIFIYIYHTTGITWLVLSSMLSIAGQHVSLWLPLSHQIFTIPDSSL